ncbi:uncharacterized protein VSU04_008424 isoform 3-T10 [Chlamydotis macqueenii]
MNSPVVPGQTFESTPEAQPMSLAFLHEGVVTCSSQRSHRSVSAALGLLMFGRQPQLRAGAPMEAVLSLRLSWIHCPVPGRKPATFRASVSRMPHQDAGRVVFCSGQRRESYQD